MQGREKAGNPSQLTVRRKTEEGRKNHSNKHEMRDEGRNFAKKMRRQEQETIFQMNQRKELFH